MKLIDLLVQELPKLGGWPERGIEHLHDFLKRNKLTFLVNPHYSYFEDWNGNQVTREQYEAALAASQAPTTDADGWIEWHGGKCPVDGYVEYRQRNGMVHIAEAEYLFWNHECVDGDIIAYRLHQSKQDAPAWNGEGLPPVGVECEREVPGGWSKCKINYLSSSLIVYQMLDSGNEYASTLSAFKFRPIRTEAERKRSDICDKIYGAMTNAERKENRSDMAEAIYDAISAGNIPGIKLEAGDAN